MPLYNLAQLRNQKTKNAKLKHRISDLDYSDSDTITINHDGISVETSLDETIAWDSIQMKIIGSIDCTNNPPFPKAHGGSAYVITAPGMFGTYWVEQGDVVLCLADTEESRDEKYEKLWFHFSKGGGGSMANLPIATSSTIGGILSGEDILVNSDGKVTIVDDSHRHSLDTLTGVKELLDAKSEIGHTHTIKDITDFNETLNAELEAFQDSFKSPMTGASDKNPGTTGMVPRPLAGDQNKFLRGDGTWAYPESKGSLEDFGIYATPEELSYSSGLTGNIQVQIKNIQDSLDMKANVSHTHSYAASASVGGPATSAEKVNHVLHILGNSEEIGQFDGSETSNVNITPESIGAAPVSHGIHVPSFSSENNDQILTVIDGSLGWRTGSTSGEGESVSYSVFTGTDGSGDGSVGLVPSPKSSDAGKFLGASGKWEKPVSSLSDLGIEASISEINMLKGVTSSIQTQLDGKAASSHTHSYAAANTPGGNAIAAEKLVNPLTIKLGSNGEITSFDGSETKNITITPEGIGAASINHGIHVSDYSEATPGQIYAISQDGTPKWVDNDKKYLVGSAEEDQIMVFNGSDGSYKTSGKSFVTTMSESPSQNNVMTEAAVAAYIESLLHKFSKKSTMVLSSFKITSEGDLIKFEDAVVIKKLVLKAESDISASGFKITRGDTELFSVENSNMVTGSLYEYNPYIHLDVSQDPLHFAFQNYSAGSAILYLEYAYDTTRDLDTGESNLYLKSDVIFESAMPHTFLSNGFLRSITIRPNVAYNEGTTLIVKIGTFALYQKEINLTKVNEPVSVDFFYSISATKENPQDITVEIGNYTEGSANLYTEYSDAVTVSTVLSNLTTTASRLTADSNRINEILDTLE